MRLFQRFTEALIARSKRRLPDFVIGGRGDPYLLRWWLIPRNSIFNIYARWTFAHCCASAPESKTLVGIDG